MKLYRNIVFLTATLSVFACAPKEQVDFALDSDNLEFPAEGGTKRINISSPGSWVANTDVPWITVSPANGNGSHECQIIVDSSITLSAEEMTRKGTVTIQDSEWNTRDISVVQDNYGYTISVDKADINIPNYKELAERYFDVKVKSNVKFKIGFLDEANNALGDDWVAASEENAELSLTKGARPRNVSLRFDWKINQEENDRIAKIVFAPVDDKGQQIIMNPANVARMDTVTVTQTQAEPKPTDPRAADSTALLSIARALNVWAMTWDSSTRMEMWNGVELWEESDEDCPENGAGRVKYARFFMFNTEDGLPYQVGWLDAAEELIFYSNENANFRKDIKIGEDITKLHKLKRLTISAYGLDDNSFPVNFYEYYDEEENVTKKTFPELEYLDISSNNFTEIPEKISPEYFPSLRVLKMSNNQKKVIYDLGNATTDDPETFANANGGLFLENTNPENSRYSTGFPMRFFKWDNLDTLQLTLNYLQGTFPTDAQIADYLNGTVEYWSGTDVIRDKDGDVILSMADSLGNSTFFSENQVPKIFPKMKRLAINLNRFHGNLSPETHKWLFYHPYLDWCDPYTFIFNQEGTDMNHNAARFDGIPISLDNYKDLQNNDLPSYYEVYREKEFSPTRTPDPDEE